LTSFAEQSIVMPPMSPDALATWVVTVMLSAMPPGKFQAPPDAVEPEAETRPRYERLARALAEVVLDPTERSLYAGPDGRRQTALLLLALSYHESGWRRDIDLGIGKQPRPGRQYWCVMQVGVDGKTAEGWTGPDLVSERERCFRAALHRLQQARGSCRAHGPDAWLRSYAAGDCTRGGKAADQRMGTFRRWLTLYPFSDSPP
jgi:hypothetical protein